MERFSLEIMGLSFLSWPLCLLGLVEVFVMLSLSLSHYFFVPYTLKTLPKVFGGRNQNSLGGFLIFKK